MKILACDTSGISCSVAILEDNRLIFESVSQNLRTHSINFMPMVEEALERCDISLDDIGLFACVVGPGSFTGLRIGVSALKAMALAKNKKTVEISSLEALSRHLPYNINRLICPIRDARRNQVYCAAFMDGKCLLNDDILMIDEFLDRVERLNESYVFVGDGVNVNKDYIIERLGNRATFVLDSALHAYYAGLIAYERQAEAVSSENLSPVYLRAPQAERERLEK